MSRQTPRNIPVGLTVCSRSTPCRRTPARMRAASEEWRSLHTGEDDTDVEPDRAELSPIAHMAVVIYGGLGGLALLIAPMQPVLYTWASVLLIGIFFACHAAGRPSDHGERHRDYPVRAFRLVSSYATHQWPRSSGSPQRYRDLGCNILFRVARYPWGSVCLEGPDQTSRD